MTPFLKLVAEDIRKRTDGDFSRTLVVFPGKRAGLFMDEFIAEDSEPVWAPRYATISELFSLFCPLTVADPIETACRIYNLYARASEAAGYNPDTLDRFYGWAERLLSDFDDIDKAMVDARALFINLGDLRELEVHDFLTDDQKQVLKSFFKDFDPDRNSYLKDRFLRLWRTMPDIYNSLRKELEAAGLGYTGMIQRRAVERLEAGETALPQGIDRIAIVGFNVLSNVERRLFKSLRKETEVLFYWDYDTYYTSEESEAGHFMKRNLQEFPNALPEELFNNLLRPKRISFVSATSDNAQARYVSSWLTKNLTTDHKDTAVVLCDETLLQPVLHALPESVTDINITKGYPLVSTNAYAGILRAADDAERKAVSQEAFVQTLIEHVVKQRDAMPADRQSPVGILETEALFTIYTVLTRFSDLVSNRTLAVQVPMLRKLLKQVLRRQTIAFHGEPVGGLQIMGVLETRCLDFDRVLILSADDNHMPRSQSDNSFIPYFLREAYGLTTQKHNAAVYAYYFHRLLSRCSCATAVWNLSGTGTAVGEMSRFMTQLIIEAPQLGIRRVALQARNDSTPHSPFVIPKPADIHERLSHLSPSALNTYMACPVKFYFERVCRLKAWEEPVEGMAANIFGTIFHEAARSIYALLSEDCTRPITNVSISRFMESGLERNLMLHLAKAFNKTKEEEPTLENSLNDYPVETEVWKRMLKDLLSYDKRLGVIRIKALEENFYTDVEIRTPQGPCTIKVGGTIDRLDTVENQSGTTLRVLDYKTGKHKDEEKFTNMDKLFKRGEKHPKNTFQTFLYSLCVEQEEAYPIRPALYYTGEANRPDFDAYLKSGQESPEDVRPLLPQFREKLTELVQEIHDPDTPFTATTEDGVCKNCDFRNLCLH